MLNQEQLEIIADVIRPLYQAFEQDVIYEIARRIRTTMTYTRTVEIMVEQLRNLGYSPAKIRTEVTKALRADKKFWKIVEKNTQEYQRDIKKRLKEIEKEAQRAGKSLIKESGDIAWESDQVLWKASEEKLTDNSFLKILQNAFADQTAAELKNLTQSTGFKAISGFESIENAYRRELDKAVIKVCSGTYSKDAVLKEVVHELAHSGLRTVNYSSGRTMQLDTAAKLALRTGCHQISSKIHDQNILNTGVNLVYVSQHWGTRNEGNGVENHELWQGKVYFIKPGTDYSEEASRIHQDRIMDLWYSTGYSIDGAHENNILGLHGVNCRHDHYAWFIGISELPEEDPQPEPKIIDGKKYDYYHMTQKQRAMERQIRALRKERIALEKLDLPTTEIDAKISAKKRDYMNFSEACGIKAKVNNLAVDSGTVDVMKLRSKLHQGLSAGTDKLGHNSAENMYIGLVDKKDPENIKLILKKYEKQIVKENIEHAVVITNAGEIYVCKGDLNGVYPDELGEKLRGASVTHNHPKDSDNEFSFSSSDIELFDKYELEVLRGIDEMYCYELNRNPEDVDELMSIFDIDEYSARHNMVILEAKERGYGYRRKKVR